MFSVQDLFKAAISANSVSTSGAIGKHNVPHPPRQARRALRNSWLCLAFLCVAYLSLSRAHAETLHVKVLDEFGNPVTEAAVFARPPSLPPSKPKTVVIDQVDKEFIRHVTVVQTGTSVLFPNHDNIRHHVYSFSAAKNFELALYRGAPAKPILFDKPGVVTLGCNIHDWMSAYIWVVDSPYFGLTDSQGHAILDVPANSHYTLGAWHPQLKKMQPESTGINVGAASQNEVILTMQLKKNLHALRLPSGLGMTVGYR